MVLNSYNNVLFIQKIVMSLQEERRAFVGSAKPTPTAKYCSISVRPSILLRPSLMKVIPSCWMLHG